MISLDAAAVKAALDIGDLCGLPAGVAVRNVVCPFPHHNDSSGDGGSHNANRHKQVFDCYGCGCGGDAIDFFGFYQFGQSYDRHNREHFQAALQAAADRAGIGPSARSHRPTPKPPPARPTVADAVRHLETLAVPERRTVGVSNAARQAEFVAAWNDKAAEYLERRGLSVELAREMGAGFRKACQGADRLTFPMTLPSGEVRQWAARALPPHAETYRYTDRTTGEVVERKVPKYAKNSKKELGLDPDAGKIGGWFNAEAMRTHRTIWIAEGVPDALALIQESGHRGVVAPIGVSLGSYDPRWFTIVGPFPRPVVIMFNRDANGTGQTKAAALKAQLDAELPGLLAVSIWTPPEPWNDWAEMLQDKAPIALPPIEDGDLPGFSPRQSPCENPRGKPAADHQAESPFAHHYKTEPPAEILSTIDGLFRAVRKLQESPDTITAAELLRAWDEAEIAGKGAVWLEESKERLLAILYRLGVLTPPQPSEGDELTGAALDHAARMVLVGWDENQKQVRRIA